MNGEIPHAVSIMAGQQLKDHSSIYYPYLAKHRDYWTSEY
jgi:hypothetical protein